MLLAALLALSILTAPGDDRAPDLVEFKNGTKLEGRIVYEDETTIIVRVGSNEREIERSSVATMRSRAANAREAIDSWRALTNYKRDDTLLLARWCQEKDLVGEATMLGHLVLAATPDDAETREFLGHQKQGKSWQVRSGSRRLQWSKLVEERKGWKNAWEFETTHFALRSNLDLETTIGILLDLEGFYRDFYLQFGGELKLREVLIPMEVHVHADDKSFVQQVSGRSAYFNREARILYVNASAMLDMGLVFHEATHQLLFTTASDPRNAAEARGNIPGWLDEGLAEYLRAGFDGKRGHMGFSREPIAPAHFQVHAQAKKPLDFSRVMTLDDGDFLASTGADLKYAQAYTLVHFCLHGAGGAHRKGFLEYLRRAYAGQSSMTDFKTALGMDEAKFERDWLEWAKTMAAR